MNCYNYAALVFDADAAWIKNTFKPNLYVHNMETRIRHKDGHAVQVRATTVRVTLPTC